MTDAPEEPTNGAVTGSETPTPDATPTTEPVNTPTPVATPTTAPTNTEVPTSTPTVTDTPTPTATNTPTPTATNSPTPTLSPTPVPVNPEATPTPRLVGNAFIGAGGRVIYTDKPMLAITFDDGPLEGYTEALVDLFMEYDSRATFFNVGYKIDNYPDSIKYAYSKGFQIGNHTLDHVFLDQVSAEEAKRQIVENEAKLRKLGIEGVIMLRPPYGAYNDTVAALVETPMIGWSVDSRDWETKNAYKTREQILADVRDGYIVLCHEIYQSTVEAMQYVVPELINKGYQLVTVDELFFAKGLQPENGKYYRMAK